MANEKWALRGEYVESCNCDYLCPCIYTNPQGPATHENCYAVMVFRIDEGHYGEVKLDGRKFALVIRSGRVMAEGHWTFGVVVDAAADAAQRQALAAVASGEAGGTPSVIRSNLVSDFRGVLYQPIEFAIDGLERRAGLGDAGSLAIAGVKSRNKSGEPFFIDNTSHPANRRLALARAKEFHVHGFGLDLDLAGKGNNGHYAPFHWTN
jgi:hypothetical protein